MTISFFIFFPANSCFSVDGFSTRTGKPESYLGVISSRGAGPWFTVSEDFLWYFPMKTNRATVTLQTADFCPFPCNMDPISKKKTKAFVLLSHASEQQLQKTWCTLVLLPVLTLKFFSVLELRYDLARALLHVFPLSSVIMALPFGCSDAAVTLLRFCLLHVKLLHERGKWKMTISFHESKAHHLPRWWVITNCCFWGVWLLWNSAAGSLKCILRDAGLQPVGCNGNNRMWSMKKAV